MNLFEELAERTNKLVETLNEISELMKTPEGKTLFAAFLMPTNKRDLN